MSVVEQHIQALPPYWMGVGEWIPRGIIGSLQGWGHLHISVCKDIWVVPYIYGIDCN